MSAHPMSLFKYISNAFEEGLLTRQIDNKYLNGSH